MGSARAESVVMTSIDRHRAVLELATNMLDDDEGRRVQGVATLSWLAARSQFPTVRLAAAQKLRDHVPNHGESTTGENDLALSPDSG